jgi:hypothetical protein
LLNPIAAAPCTNRFEQMFHATAPGNVAPPRWSTEESRSRWPELPPSADDVEAAPVNLPNLARLRDEQDQGAWSG